MTLNLRVLSATELEAIHAATLDVLKATGVVVESAGAVDLLAQHGADVQGDRVRIPVQLIERSLRSAPRSIQMFDRSGKPCFALGSGQTYFGGWLDNKHFRDGATRELRAGSLDDLVAMVKVCDRLQHVDWMGWAGWVSDVPVELRNRVIFRTVVSHTLKPIVTTANDVVDLKAQIDMAAIVAGGYEQLRARPFLANASEPVSPLLLSSEAVSKLQMCAAHGIPLAFYPMTEAGSSAPSMPAGGLIVGNAEVLAGLVIHQLTAPGAPFIYGNMPGMMDMRTLAVSYGSPDLFLGLAAVADLGHWYGLPVYGTAGVGDSIEIDAQLGAENALSILLALLTGADLVHDIGVFGGGMAASIEANVFADELIGMIRSITRGIGISDASQATDAIAEVGPRGSFLAHDSTLERFREYWYPTLFFREPVESWLRKGVRADLADRLHNRVRELLDSYEAHPLGVDVEAALDEYQRGWSTAIEIATS